MTASIYDGPRAVPGSQHVRSCGERTRGLISASHEGRLRARDGSRSVGNGVVESLHPSGVREPKTRFPVVVPPWKRREPHSPSPYPLPRGEGAQPVVGNVIAPQWAIARRRLLPLLRGEGRVRRNGCLDLEMGSVKFHAAPNPGRASGVLGLGVPAYRRRHPVVGLMTFGVFVVVSLRPLHGPD
jgi:hypothetical protein